CLDDIINDLVNNAVSDEKKVEVGIPDAEFCDPNTKCNGTINNSMNLTPLPSTVLSFCFTAVGPDVNPFVIKSDTETADPFTFSFTGPGPIRNLAPDYNDPCWPVPLDSTPSKPLFYSVDQINVTDANGITLGPPFVTVHSCPGGDKGPLEINDLEGIYNV